VIEQLTWIDADIFDPDFLNRVFLLLYSLWALTSGISLLNTLACSEIGRFVDFMLDFYAKENRRTLVRAIHVHGSNNMDGAEGISEKVRQAEPAFAELGIDPKHFSDTFLFSKFLQDMNAALQEEQEEGGKEEESGTLPNISPRKEPPESFILQDENGGTIDPNFVPIISVKTEVPESQTFCGSGRV